MGAHTIFQKFIFFAIYFFATFVLAEEEKTFRVRPAEISQEFLVEINWDDIAKAIFKANAELFLAIDATAFRHAAKFARKT